MHGCKTDHGEKRVGHGEVTRYKSRVFPFYLSLFVHATFRIWKEIGHMVCDPSEQSARQTMALLYRVHKVPSLGLGSLC